ncbi:hypothetical protein CLOM_g11997 [Closterium sp. NIES-68]|nr:hypothetical protein CLOM_g11997 [Closterium sp. NIES-68]GJP84579.1 hypothetical protein CLOP_g14638 [Closterium sp. NIES-67]
MALSRHLTSPCAVHACLGVVYRVFSTAIPSAPPFAASLAPSHALTCAASSRSDQPTLPCTSHDLEHQGSAAEPLIHPAIPVASGPSVLPPTESRSTPDDANQFAVMAVPKRKVTPSRKGIRNGPKALKAVPVVVRCLSCGVVKLQHQFCCRDGDRYRTAATQ